MLNLGISEFLELKKLDFMWAVAFRKCLHNNTMKEEKGMKKLRRCISWLLLIALFVTQTVSAETVRDYTCGEDSSHSVVLDPYVPATTASTGLSEGAHCADCGAVIRAQEELPVLGEMVNKAEAQMEVYRQKYAGQSIVQTGVSKSTYADIVARCLAAYFSVHDLYSLDYKELDSKLQAYSRVIASMAVLVDDGDVTKYREYAPELFGDHQQFCELFQRMMTEACTDAKLYTKTETSSASDALNFSIVELSFAYVLTEDEMPEDVLASWAEELSAVTSTKDWYSTSRLNNRVSYVTAGEQIREAIGLTDSEEYIDDCLANIKRRFTDNGMWTDVGQSKTTNPFLYDLSVRAHLSLVDSFGYEGAHSGLMREWLRRGGYCTLFLQASNGEIPYGGRSNQYLFNEVLISAVGEYEANYYHSIGDEYLAGVYKRSAHLAAQSVLDYLNAGKHIKNYMQDNTYGIDPYGQFDKYMATMSSFLAIGYYYADDNITENQCPAELGGFVVSENLSFSSIQANCGGYTIEILTSANTSEDAIGMGRILRNGIPAALGLSSSFAGNSSYLLPEEAVKQSYSFDVAWKNAEGSLIKLSDYQTVGAEVTPLTESEAEVAFSVTYTGEFDGVNSIVETYHVTSAGVIIEAELVGAVTNEIYYTVPLLKSSGDLPQALNPQMEAEENLVRLYTDEYEYQVSSDGQFVSPEELIYNRNGIYHASCFAKEGNTISLKASLKTSAEITGMGTFSVTASEDKITLNFDRYQDEGKTAQIYMMNAYEYYVLDENRGYSTSVLGPEDSLSIGEISLDGGEHSVEIDRYDEAGADRLYKKFYLASETTLYQGPMWVTSVPSIYADVDTVPRTDNIKGIPMVGSETEAQHQNRLAMEEELNGKTAKLDIVIGSLMYSNEKLDADGNLVENTSIKSAIEFTASNGKTYYFKNGTGANTIKRLDGVIKRNTEAGIRTTVVVQLQAGNAPYYMVPEGAREGGASGTQLIGINTLNEDAVGYITAFFEFMAQRYSSGEYGFVEAFVIGNEIDFPVAWNINFNLENGMPSVEDYTEEYYRSLRLASLAVQRYSDEIVCLVPFTHYWAKTGNEVDPKLYNSDAVYSYAPKQISDILLKKSRNQGNFYWGYAPHPYAISLTTDDPIAFDYNWKQYVTCDLDTAFLTYENIEVWDMYLQREEAKCGGRVRPVYLTESGVTCNGDTEEEQARQAISIAYIYFKISLLEPFVSWPYVNTKDSAAMGTGQGLIAGTDINGPRRMAYELWGDIGTIPIDEFCEKYEKYISKLWTFTERDTFRSMLMKAGRAFGSPYNWGALWNERYGTTSYIIGDVDEDGEVTSDDAVYLLYYTLLPESYPVSQPVDYDGDGEITSDDAVYLLYYTLLPDSYPLY